MTALAAILIAASATLHASWNLLSKRSSSSLSFFLFATLGAAALFSPVLILLRDIVAGIPARVWMLLTAAGLCQASYYVGLHFAYRSGELSVAYPLLRALPVLFILLVNLALGRGRAVGGLAVGGMAAVVMGCVVLPLRHFAPGELRRYLSRWAMFAIVAALGTTGYTIIDDTALEILRSTPSIQRSAAAISATYVTLEMLAAGTILALAISVAPGERSRLRSTDLRGLLRGGLAGVMITVTYAMVLVSMAFVRNVSYVAAFRQLSIPLGAAFGILFQHEPAAGPKILGVALISLGLVLVGIG